jgi:hypothetical protein
MTPAYIKKLIAHMDKVDPHVMQPGVRDTLNAARAALAHLAKENARLWDEVCSADSDY